MKKLLLSALLLISSCTPSFALEADDILDKVELKQGIVYSLKDSEFAHVSTAPLLQKGNLALEAGYIDNGKLLGAVSYQLFEAKDYTDIILLREMQIRPGLYVAFDEMDTGDPKVDYGISLTLLTVTF